MAKFSGIVGFVKPEETSLHVYTNVVTEKRVRGDVLSSSYGLQENNNLTDELELRNSYSLVMTAYLKANYQHLRYLVVDGTPYKVSSVVLKRPRVEVWLGGVYNGQRPD